MPSGLRAIETRYKGYRFRSRLEARWAVFFDGIGLPYEYEPEGFDLDGVRYLPDFRLPLGVEACPCGDPREPGSIAEVAAWVEIKPAGQGNDPVTIAKAVKLAVASATPVYVFSGDPYEGAYTVTMWHQDGERVAWCEPWLWSECPVCGTVDLQHRAGVCGTSTEDDGLDYPMFQCMHCDVHVRSWKETKEWYWHKGFWIVLKRGWTATRGPKLSRAFMNARGARFEHGESGASW